MKVGDVGEPLLSKIDFHFARFELPLNVQEEAIISSITLYRSPLWKRLLFALLCLCTAGLAYLFMRWELWFKLLVLYSKSSLKSATHVLIKNPEGETQLIDIFRKLASINEERRSYKLFEYRLYTYYLDEDTFKPIQTNFQRMKNTEIITQYCRGILNPDSIAEQYGYNDTTIPNKSTLQILIDEILSPFYLFQIFSVVLWSIEEYYSYATVIFITSLISVIITLRETNENFQKLRRMTAQDTIEVLYRGNNPVYVSQKEIIVEQSISQNRIMKNSKEIVPGDLIEVRDGWIVPCDCILLNGACIINESMLTGESIPILKSSIPFNDKIYQPQEESKQYTLFAGTKCIETRHPQKGKIPVMAIAVQTGFSTIKGQLVRSILFPKPTTFSFYRDSLLFVAVLAVMAFIGFLLTIKDQIEEFDSGNLGIGQMVVNSLDLVTITVPPALPTCLSIGVSFAISRLGKKQIFCISPNRVNVAGKITIMCFDKTGTLTEDGLDLYGVRPVGYSDKKSKLCFHDLVVDMRDLKLAPNCEFSFDDKSSIYGHTNLQPKGLVLEIMASCHGLARVDGSLIGDPLEVKMFEATEYELDDLKNEVTNKEGHTIKILQRFEFSSTLQRMSVIVCVNGKLRAHVKGSPEKLRELCTKESIPSSFHKILEFYSKLGFRVLACGSKPLQAECSREKVECQLTFMGFLVMQNKLKPATRRAIETLQDACIRTVMVTGDNVLTAISVARQCRLVQPTQRIFLGDLAENVYDGRNKIVWKDFEMSENVLDPDNLSPELDIKDDPDQEEDLAWTKDNPDRQTLEIILADEEAQQESQQQRKSGRLTKSKYMSYKEEEKKLQLENLDHLIEDQDPWKTDEPFVIAISGKAFDLLYRQVESNPKARKVFGKMLEKAQIFARMKPEQKALLIQLLQKISRKALCGMCGDGANDCGALKAADVGISLSEAEASIAAPFTSKVQDISCVVKLLREGRASLVTSFQCFKYMALYSMIQFCTVTLLYQVISNLSDYQFLYIDLFIIIPLAGTMGQTKSYKKLTQFQPGSNLISFPVLMSVIGQTIIQVGFQCFIYYTLVRRSWYVDAVTIHEDIGDADDHFAMEICFENTTLFLYANFQYVFQCLAFSIGKPFRRPFYSNYYFTVWISFIFLFNTYILFLSEHPANIPNDIFQFFFEYTSENLDENQNPVINTEVPYKWLALLFVTMVINMALTILFEKYAVPIVTRYYRAKKRLIVKRYRYPENPYLKDESMQ